MIFVIGLVIGFVIGFIVGAYKTKRPSENGRWYTNGWIDSKVDTLDDKIR